VVGVGSGGGNGRECGEADCLADLLCGDKEATSPVCGRVLTGAIAFSCQDTVETTPCQ
jgi:hypothetical protein